MKVRCDRSQLYEAASVAAVVVPGRTPKPALSCLKLEAADRRLMISATDLELGLRRKVGAVEVLKPGAAVIPADRLTAILRETHDETVELETDGAAVKVTCADSRFRIFGFDPLEFPAVGEFEEAAGFTIKAGVLRRLIERTQFAAAKEITRYAINGVLMEPRGEQLKLVGTDGKRLAQARGPLTGPAAEEKTAVCPLKTMGLILKLLVDPEADVDLRLGETELKLRCGASVLTSRLVEGAYPKYDEVIPKDSDRSAEFDAVAFTSAVKRASLLVSAESRRVVFKFGPEQLELKSSAPEHGDSEVNLTAGPAAAPAADGASKPADYVWQGPPLRIEFNPDYLIDGVKASGLTRTKFEFKSPERPGVLRSENEFIYVVMPLSSRGGE